MFRVATSSKVPGWLYHIENRANITFSTLSMQCKNPNGIILLPNLLRQCSILHHNYLARLDIFQKMFWWPNNLQSGRKWQCRKRKKEKLQKKGKEEGVGEPWPPLGPRPAGRPTAPCPPGPQPAQPAQLPAPRLPPVPPTRCAPRVRPTAPADTSPTYL